MEMNGLDCYSPQQIAERVESACLAKAATPLLSLSWLWRNLVAVIAGDLVGGSVLVALVYYVIYRRPARGLG